MTAILTAPVPAPGVTSPPMGTWARDLPDREIAARLCAGDERALARVVEYHGRLVTSLVRRLTGDAGAAEEVAQEVFVTLWTRPERFDPDLGSLRTFLAVLARRRAIDWLRRQDRARRRDEAVSDTTAAVADDTAEHVTRRSEQERVRRAVAELPGDQRRAIELAYFAGLSSREVADALAIPEGTAKSRLRLGLARLARSLAPSSEVTA